MFLGGPCWRQAQAPLTSPPTNVTKRFEGIFDKNKPSVLTAHSWQVQCLHTCQSGCWVGVQNLPGLPPGGRGKCEGGSGAQPSWGTPRAPTPRKPQRNQPWSWGRRGASWQLPRRETAPERRHSGVVSVFLAGLTEPCNLDKNSCPVVASLLKSPTELPVSSPSFPRQGVTSGLAAPPNSSHQAAPTGPAHLARTGPSSSRSGQFFPTATFGQDAAADGVTGRDPAGLTTPAGGISGERSPRPGPPRRPRRAGWVPGHSSRQGPQDSSPGGPCPSQ